MDGDKITDRQIESRVEKLPKISACTYYALKRGWVGKRRQQLVIGRATTTTLRATTTTRRAAATTRRATATTRLLVINQ